MKRIFSSLFTYLLALTLGFGLIFGLASPSTAAESPAARYGTGSFTVGAASLPASGCINHPMRTDVNIGYETDGWFIAVSVNRPDGSIADSWVSEIYWDDWGSSYFEEPVLLCTGLDMPGTYTVSGTLNSVNNGSSVVSKQSLTPASFVVSPFVAPVTPPVTPPPAPTTVDVTGKVLKKFVERGVKFTFRSRALPAGSVAGDKLQWSIVSGDKVKSFSQGPEAESTKTLRFPKNSGAHKIKVLRNGKVAMRVTVRT